MEGRFIGKDPIGFKGGDVNLYGYVHNNSTNNTDPFGLSDSCCKKDAEDQYNNCLKALNTLNTGLQVVCYGVAIGNVLAGNVPGGVILGVGCYFTNVSGAAIIVAKKVCGWQRDRMLKRCELQL